MCLLLSLYVIFLTHKPPLNFCKCLYIQVRLIKCTIENIVVDISFNQTGGICALCFLELV